MIIIINVTKTHLPNKEKFVKYVDEIYESGQITNKGQFVRLLKEKLEEYLNVKNLLLVSNGTTALQVAYKALNLKGEVLTTPFSFVATTSSLVWEGLTPLFVDIDKDTFCMNYNKIESKITKNTSAILPVHVFGNGCDIEEIEIIAIKNNLKIIYDAAHAFGIKYKDESILKHGDISVISFHATKIFHTIEGGALIIKDDDTYRKAERLINFGFSGVDKIDDIGINAKMNEFQAAMGLCVLDDMVEIIEKRKAIFKIYENGLKNNEELQFQKYNINCNQNYGYFPVVFKDEKSLLEIKEKLEKEQIYPRRYFYPSLDKLAYINSEDMEISNDISKRILCLPISDSLDPKDAHRILDYINN